MTKKSKDAGKAGAVELSEEQLGEATGGLASITDGTSNTLLQKVQKVRLPIGSVRANKS
jgi:hypothetical protein